MTPPKKKDETAEEQRAEEQDVPELDAKEDAPETEAPADGPEAEAPADEPADDEPADDEPDEDEDDADDEPEADEPEDGDEPEPEPEAEADAGEPAAKGRRRRGSAETGAGTSRTRQPSRRPDGEIVVRARARYVRSAPRKARLVMDHIRGRDVEQARAMLTHGPRAVSVDILKLLDSAVANAESNYELGADELRIARAFVDEGPTIKRYRPRALGRATRILKRTSHMTIELTNGTR
jgi:large subunit ribosomal protein L22